MTIRNLIISSQLSPPPQRPHVLTRPRIQQALGQAADYPVTIIEAGTGYGKSTAVISFLEQANQPVFWFTISGSDRDPRLFLANLFSAFDQPGFDVGEAALNVLEGSDSSRTEAMIVFLNDITSKLKQEVFLVLDDFHKVNGSPEIIEIFDWMLERLPAHVHVIISTRRAVEFSSMNKWRVKNRVNEISSTDLAFTPAEIGELFQTRYGLILAENDVRALYEKTEGWVIGLQMIWQSLQNQTSADLQVILEDIRGSQTALFSYLAEEVFGQLSEEKQHFLLHTSVLRELDSVICDFLLSFENSNNLLNEIHADGLFLEELRAGVYRYHNMFRDFLRTRLDRTDINSADLHLKVASYYTAHQFWERTMTHLLQAKDFSGAAQILDKIGDDMILTGRQESVSYWIGNLPQDIQDSHPQINFLKGEINRYMSHFNQALENYHAAEVLYKKAGSAWGLSLALRGRAQVYLDTVRPVNAVQLLQDALELIDSHEDPEAAANVLTLIAENQLNLGFPRQAEEYLQRAVELSSGLETEIDFIRARILLRTGRMDEGIRLLEQAEGQLKSPLARPQRFHREASLLLSLFHAIKGDVEKAEINALKGIQIGDQLSSVFVQSVGYMRLGHTIQLQDAPPWTNQKIESAVDHYDRAIDKIDVTRIHVEPLWGMCRAYGYFGEPQKAESVAAEALEIAKTAGDEWISVLIRISIGAAQAMAGSYEQAERYLSLAEFGAAKVEDPLSLSAAQLWLALTAWKQGFTNTVFFYLAKALPVIRKQKYDFLLKQVSLLGLQDAQSAFPLLLFARENGIEADFAEELLLYHSQEETAYHPGYTLWIRTFGALEVWRGSHRVRSKEWKREKARQLMMLLTARKGSWISREVLIDALWPDHDPESGLRSFKVVLNALNQVLTPERPKGADPFFIERRQNLYRLNPKARIQMDTDWFEANKDSRDLNIMKEVINLYRGSYFEGCPLQENLTAEEQYYHQQFLLLIERLVEKLVDKEDYHQSLEYLHLLLSKENLWESAYTQQMEIYQKMGKPALVHSVYEQAKKAYQDRLDSSVPSIIEKSYQQFQQNL